MSHLPDSILAKPTASAVVLVDLQKDFLRPEGRLPIALGTVSDLLECVAAVVSEATASGIPVVQIVNAFPRWSIANLFRNFAAVAGSPGAELDERVSLGDVPVFEKKRSSAFTNPQLERWLRTRNIDQLIVLGVFADGCVRRTVEAARERGFAVWVPRAGTGSRSAAAVTHGLNAMTRAGAVVL